MSSRTVPGATLEAAVRPGLGDPAAWGKTACLLLLVPLITQATSLVGATSSDGGSIEVSRPIQLVYDERLQAEGFPSPALRVTVGATSAWLLVDTGAGVHTLAAWFVHDAGIRISDSTVSAQDSSGRHVAMRGARDIELTLAGEPGAHS